MAREIPPRSWEAAQSVETGFVRRRIAHAIDLLGFGGDFCAVRPEKKWETLGTLVSRASMILRVFLAVPEDETPPRWAAALKRSAVTRRDLSRALHQPGKADNDGRFGAAHRKRKLPDRINAVFNLND